LDNHQRTGGEVPSVELGVDANPEKRNRPPKGANWIAVAAIALVVGGAPFLAGVSNYWLKWIPEKNPFATERQPAINPPSNWHSSTNIDPITDKETVTFVLTADRSPAATLPVTLIVACSDRTTSVGIHWQDYLGAEEVGPYLLKDVTLRMGAGVPEEKAWVTNPAQTTTWAGQPTREMVEGFIHNDRVAAQVTPYNSSPVAVTFSTVGLESLLQANFSLCGWSP